MYTQLKFIYPICKTHAKSVAPLTKKVSNPRLYNPLFSNNHVFMSEDLVSDLFLTCALQLSCHSCAIHPPFASQISRWTKCSAGSNHPVPGMLCSGVDADKGPRKTERSSPHCGFRCANPGSSSLLQTKFHLFIWDTRIVFFWPQKRLTWGPDQAMLAQHL